MKLLSVLWLVLPSDYLGLIVVGMAMASIVGLVRPRSALGILLLVIAMPFIAALAELVLSALPWYLALGILLLLTMSVLREVLELFFGREAAGHILGHLVLAAFGAVFRLLALPFRLAGAFIQGGLRR